MGNLGSDDLAAMGLLRISVLPSLYKRISHKTKPVCAYTWNMVPLQDNCRYLSRPRRLALWS